MLRQIVSQYSSTLAPIAVAAVTRLATPESSNVDLRDIRTSASGKGVRLEVRRSSLGDSRAQTDLRDGRRTGW